MCSSTGAPASRVSSRFVRGSPSMIPRRTNEYTLGQSTTTRSECFVAVQEVEDYATGAISCRDLIPTSSSLDGSLAAGVLASITLDFNCPLSMEDPVTVVGTGGSGSGGSSSGGSGAGGSGGGVATTGSCVGSATPCLLLSSLTCNCAQGCTWEESCEGTPESCYYQFSQLTCAYQSGCYWSTLTDDCSGLATSCGSFSSSSSCTNQLGCSYDDECTGVVSPCSVMTNQFDCIDQPGCSWQAN